MKLIRNDISNSLKVLNKGGIILFPTDTIWGIGCDATNPAAIEKISQIKQREEHKSMLILLDNKSKLKKYVANIPEFIWETLENKKKSLTIIYPGAKNLAPQIIAPDGSVAIRITNELFSNSLVRQFGKPVVATSANLTSKPYPRNFSEIDSAIVSAVDYVVKYRQYEKTLSKPSGIIKVMLNGEIAIIR